MISVFRSVLNALNRETSGTGPTECRKCGAEITKTPGFWNLWRVQDANDPEYCPVGNHTHRPI
jgi:hypothetical protein